MVENDDSALEDFVLITVLAKEDTIEYVVPKLTEVKLQWESCQREIIVFDGFAWSCEALKHPLPAIMKVLYSYENAFIIEVERKSSFIILITSYINLYYIEVILMNLEHVYSWSIQGLRLSPTLSLLSRNLSTILKTRM